MNTSKIDIVIHPDRLRILQVLTTEPMSIEEISKSLKSVPQSSVYRHMRKLHQAKLVKIQKVLRIRGAQERIYQIKIAKLRSYMKQFNIEFKEILGL